MPKTLDFTKPHVLRNEEEYDRAIAEIEALLDRDPPAGTEEYERLEFLSVLVDAYEEEHYPMGEDVTPRQAVEFMLDQKEMARADLHDLMGGRSRVSEFFSGKRPLSKGQAHALREALGIPLDVLLPGG